MAGEFLVAEIGSQFWTADAGKVEYVAHSHLASAWSNSYDSVMKTPQQMMI